jgi:hypothetical protein
MTPAISYGLQRHVPASTRPDGPPNCHIAMVVFAHPQTGAPQTLSINEGFIAAAAGNDPMKQRDVIEHEIKRVLAEMTAGAEFTPIIE